MPPNPSRVLFLPKWYPNPDDPQLGVFVRQQAEALAKELSIVLIYSHPDPEAEETFELRSDTSRGFHEILVHYRNRGARPLRFLRYFQALTRGWEEATREGWMPDLVHAHILNRPAMFANRLKRRLGIPFVITEHWSGFLDGRADQRSFLKRLATRSLLEKADGVSTVSKKLGDALQERASGIDPVTIPNFVPDPGPPQPIPDRPFRFFNVSDMVDDTKKLSELLNAFRELIRERNEGIELHIVGGGPDEEMIRRHAEELDFHEGSVRFYGRLPNEEVQKLFPSMSALVLNSIHETFGVTLIEALAHGRPVASTRCGGPEEILREEDLGLLFPPGDREATKDAMKQLLDGIHGYDPQRLHSYAIEEYGEEKMRDRTFDLYRRAMAKGDGNES